MTYCTTCGNENPEGSAFCARCGRALALPPLQQQPPVQQPQEKNLSGLTKEEIREAVAEGVALAPYTLVLPKEGSVGETVMLTGLGIVLFGFIWAILTFIFTWIMFAAGLRGDAAFGVGAVVSVALIVAWYTHARQKTPDNSRTETRSP